MLEEQLKDVRSRHPSRSEVKPMLDTLEGCHSFRRTGATRRAELDTWRANQAGGGLITSVRNTFSSLVLWSTDPDISMTPPSYTHRQLLAAIRILGSMRVLQGLLDELKLQSEETGGADLALDIAATLICAQAAYHAVLDPSRAISAPKGPVLTLRDALNLQHDSLAKVIEKDPQRAELIVRLHRRVDALTAIPQMSAPAVQSMVDNIMGGISLEDVGNGEAQQQSGQIGLEQGQQQQMSLDAQGAASLVGPGGTDEIFDNEMLGGAAAGTGEAGGVTTTFGTGDQSQNQGAGVANSGMMSTADFDEMLGMADMGVGNPEFIDLDMEGMF
jgi:mediator of RNA polymerase II transcription subunit 5